MLSAADVELEQPPASEDDPVSETAAGVENVVERPVAPKSALRKGGAASRRDCMRASRGFKPEGLHVATARRAARMCGVGRMTPLTMVRAGVRAGVAV